MEVKGTLCMAFAVALAAGLALATAASEPLPKTYHLDSVRGDDAADGLSPETAWRTLEKLDAVKLQGGDRVLFARGGVWRGKVRLQSGAPERRTYYGPYGEGPKPLFLGSWARDREEDWTEARPGLWQTQPTNPAAFLGGDIGLICFDDGRRTGWKKFDQAALTNEYDFCYDPATDRVCLRLDENPAKRHQRIELGRKITVFSHMHTRHCEVDSLAVRYSGAFAFAGMGATDYVVRNCSMRWIGGAVQGFSSAGKPIRYGNAIEFWGSASDVLIEGCDIAEVYDAGISPQASRDLKTMFRNIVIRGNLIRNCEFSLEIWHHAPEGRFENFLFERNTCLDAGCVWSHAQRPDRNGTHLNSYRSPCSFTNVVFRENVFSRATDFVLRFDVDWSVEATFDRNLYYVPENAVFNHYAFRRDGRPGGKTIRYGAGPEAFAAYQRGMDTDRNSVYGKPILSDPQNGDWRLKPGTPGATLAADGGPVGMRTPVSR